MGRQGNVVCIRETKLEGLTGIFLRSVKISSCNCTSWLNCTANISFQVAYEGFVEKLFGDHLTLSFSKKAIQDVLDSGKACVLDIDMQVRIIIIIIILLLLLLLLGIYMEIKLYVSAKNTTLCQKVYISIIGTSLFHWQFNPKPNNIV